MFNTVGQRCGHSHLSLLFMLLTAFMLTSCGQPDQSLGPEAVHDGLDLTAVVDAVPPKPAEVCAVRSFPSRATADAARTLAAPAAYRAGSELFGALADPTRFALVHVLVHHELCTCDLAATVGVTESGVSQHLRILRALRLVKARRAGKFVYYSLDDAHVGAIVQRGLAHQGHDGGEPRVASA